MVLGHGARFAAERDAHTRTHCEKIKACCVGAARECWEEQAARWIATRNAEPQARGVCFFCDVSAERDVFSFALRVCARDALQTDREIQLCVRYIAQEINKRFVGKDILLCAVLKGAYFFLADLTRLLTIPYTTYFVEASSYGESQQQVGEAYVRAYI